MRESPAKYVLRSRCARELRNGDTSYELTDYSIIFSSWNNTSRSSILEDRCDLNDTEFKMPEKHIYGSCISTNKICDHRKINKTSLPLVAKSCVNRKKKINQNTEFVSSKDRKRDYESSKDVLPPQDTPTKDLYLKSSYTVDFDKKEGQPACTRPCSVTRRNRPHPLMVCNVSYINHPWLLFFGNFYL